MAISSISTVGMSHEEWLSERRKGIGGSDAGAIVGMNKYRSSFDVYADKFGLIPPVEDNEAMRIGRDLEEYVAKRFCEKMNKKVRKRNAILINSEYPFARANVDRLVIGEEAGLECKTTSVLNLTRYKNGEYPSEYYCQCVHYLAVTKLKRWYLAVLVLGKGLEVFVIERDEEEITALMSAEKDFWENNVQKGEPPAPSGTESEDDSISYMYPNGEPEKNVTLLSDFDKMLDRRIEVAGLIKKLESEKKQIEQEIKLYMGDAEKASSNRYAISWSNVVRRDMDMKRVVNELLSDVDLRDYITEKVTRRFTVKEIKE